MTAFRVILVAATFLVAFAVGTVLHSVLALPRMVSP
jgi:hypothetical protein